MISILNKADYLKITFVKHAMIIFLALASMSFSTMSMASADEDIEQKAWERHKQEWNDKINYDVANEIIKCGNIFLSRNREIGKYNDTVKEYRSYEHDRSEEARVMRALAEAAILRLEGVIDDIEQQFEYSCEHSATKINVQTLYHACQSLGVMKMRYDDCGEAYIARDEYDEQF